MADEYICSDCGYTSLDLGSQKNCPLCGGAIIETYGGIEKFEEVTYPENMVEEVDPEEDPLEDVPAEEDEDLTKTPGKHHKVTGKVRTSGSDGLVEDDV